VTILNPYSYRQTFALSNFPCPNGTHFQTRMLLLHLLLSEYRHRSDSLASFTPHPVRMIPSFRLACLLLHLILSEYCHPSDSLAPFTPFPVRILPSFRLACSLYTFSCPNRILPIIHVGLLGLGKIKRPLRMNILNGL
jgi:hypothetical protein